MLFHPSWAPVILALLGSAPWTFVAGSESESDRPTASADSMAGGALLNSGPPADGGGCSAPVTVAGQQFLDGRGRPLILHGINVVNKSKAEGYVGDLGPGDFAVIRRWGMNCVRLGIFWEGLEPEPGRIDEAYLERIAQLVAWAGAEGLVVLLDMHQDLYSVKFGDGAPLWATLDEDRPHATGAVWSDAYYASEAVQTALDNFWANRPARDGVGLQDHYARVWRRVAERFKGEAAVLGFDLMNEPMPGADARRLQEALLGRLAELLTDQPGGSGLDAEALAALQGTPQGRRRITEWLADVGLYEAALEAGLPIMQEFDRTRLQPFYERMRRAIREVDLDRILFLEPAMSANLGIPSALVPLTDDWGRRDPRQAYAPHGYDLVVDTSSLDLTSPDRVALIFRRHGELARRHRWPMLVGEWGAYYLDPRAADAARFVVRQFDALGCGDTYWDYSRALEGSPLLEALRRPSRAVRSFPVRDYGAVADGRTECGSAIRRAIQAAIASGAAAEVVLEEGSYRVAPELAQQPCFPIRGATNLLVRGAGTGTRIVVTDPSSTGFSFTGCQEVALRDVAIDYDPVPFCQGTVRAVDVAGGTFDLEVDPGFPTPEAENFLRAIEPYGKWGMIMDRASRRIRSGTPDHFMTPRWEHREGRVWRFFTLDEHHRRNLVHMRPGDAYVHLARGHGCAVLAQGCDGVRLQGVTVHASPGLAVGLVANRGEVRVRGLEVRFAPGTPRLLTANADGVHCQQNRTGPIIEQCKFEGMADDAVNIYAPPNVLRETRSATQWLVSPTVPVQPGDRLQVLDPRTGQVRGVVRAIAVRPERAGLLITFEPPFEGAIAGEDHRVADTLYNLDACGAGFQIRDNHMRGNRRYGCLLRAGEGLVENNTFEDTTGAGVVLANEPDWPEGPVPWSITIRGNRFLRGGTCLGYADSPHGAALALRSTRLGHGLAETAGIQGVVIENNRFEDRAGTALFLGGTREVTARGNHIFAMANTELRRSGPAILVERGSAIALLNNSVDDPRPGTVAAVEIGSAVAPGEAGVRVSGLTATLTPGASPVLDRRGTP